MPDPRPVLKMVETNDFEQAEIEGARSSMHTSKGAREAEGPPSSRRERWRLRAGAAEETPSA